MRGALPILGAILGGLTAHLGGAILGGIVGFVIEETLLPRK